MSLIRRLRAIPNMTSASGNGGLGTIRPTVPRRGNLDPARHCDQRNLFAQLNCGLCGLAALIVAGVDALLPSTALELAEFVDEQIEGFISILTGGAGNQVRASYFQPAFGDMLLLRCTRVIDFEIDPNPHDVAVLVQ